MHKEFLDFVGLKSRSSRANISRSSMAQLPSGREFDRERAPASPPFAITSMS
jgi:hypothetical protein